MPTIPLNILEIFGPKLKDDGENFTGYKCDLKLLLPNESSFRDRGNSYDVLHSFTQVLNFPAR